MCMETENITEDQRQEERASAQHSERGCSFPYWLRPYSMYQCDRRTKLKWKGILVQNLILFVSVDTWGNPDDSSERHLRIDRTEIRMWAMNCSSLHHSFFWLGAGLRGSCFDSTGFYAQRTCQQVRPTLSSQGQCTSDVPTSALGTHHVVGPGGLSLHNLHSPSIVQQ